MGFMVVLHRHLWLTLANLKDTDRKTLLNTPITPSDIFGDAVESVVECFSEAQKSSDAVTRVSTAFEISLLFHASFCTESDQTARRILRSTPS